MELWINNLKPSGSCNLLNALKQAFKQKDIDSIVVIAGSLPDQPPQVLVDYTSELHSGSDVIIHAVTYHNQLLETKVSIF